MNLESLSSTLRAVTLSELGFPIEYKCIFGENKKIYISSNNLIDTPLCSILDKHIFKELYIDTIGEFDDDGIRINILHCRYNTLLGQSLLLPFFIQYLKINKEGILTHLTFLKHK